jgi:hypothetical protein
MNEAAQATELILQKNTPTTNGHADLCLFCAQSPRRSDRSDYCQQCWEAKQGGAKLQPKIGVLKKKLTPEAKIRYARASMPQCEECGKNPALDGEKLCRKCARHGKTKLRKLQTLEFPETSMYGWLGKFARQIDAPPSAAYPVLLGLAAGYGVPKHKRTRTNLYVSVIGVKGSGKSRTIDNAQEAWLPPTEIMVINKYPGSEVGLIQLLGGKKAKDMTPEDYYPKPYLLVQDEMRITFNKMDIKGSSLPNMFNEMFYKDEFGTASKQGHQECCARLSVVGGLTCESANEFAEIYGTATAQGTYDRTIFGIMPDDWEFDDAWEPPKEANGEEVRRRSKTCAIPYEVYEAVNEWRKKDFRNRKRLGELVLRVALITASLNHDDMVTMECLVCAIEFVEWQERLRHHYAPSETDDLDGKAERAIIRALEHYEGWVDWRTLCHHHNLYRAAGSAARLNRAKKNLAWDVIEDEREEDKEGKLRYTGRVRIIPMGDNSATADDQQNVKKRD